MSKRILVVDDEPRFIRLLEANLSADGYEVITATNGLEALDVFIKESPDLIILDVIMPELDGLSTLNRIREFSSIPVIMLTAKGDEADKIEGLNHGADDYIVKPFSADELLARVRAVLRRVEYSSPPTQINFFSHGELKIDLAKAEITIIDKPVFLSATEYRVLLQFAHNVGKTLSAKELLSNVWGEEYKNEKEILWVCISRLRQKLENDPKNPEHITTLSGKGYIMPIIVQEN